MNSSTLPESFEQFSVTGLHAIPIALGLVDSEMRFLYCNPAFERMVNEEAQHIMSQGILYFIPPDRHASLKQKLVDANRSESQSESLTIPLLANTRVALTDVNLTLSKWTRADGTRSLWLITFQDFSQLRREHTERSRLLTELQVAQLRASLQFLTATISGFVLSGIERIGATTQHAQESRGNQNELGASLHEILAQCSETRSLITRLNQVKLSSEARRTLNINDLVPAIVKMIRCVAPPSIRISISSPSSPITTQVDVPQLVTALTNLCMNAVESFGLPTDRPSLPPDTNHNQEKSILVAVTETRIVSPKAELLGLAEGNYIAISVQDNGLGMSPDQIALAKEAYYSTKPAELNVGLGINLVQACASAHQGALDFRSVEGQGTVVTLYLAKTTPRTSAAAPSSERTGKMASPHTSMRSVLFADDEPQMRTVGERYFRRLGFSVQLAEDGQQALDLFTQSPGAFSLVVLDVSMPNMTGIASLEAIQQLVPTQKALLITGADTMPLPPSLLSSDNVYVLQKPWSQADLEEILKLLLNPKRLISHWFAQQQTFRNGLFAPSCDYFKKRELFLAPPISRGILVSMCGVSNQTVLVVEDEEKLLRLLQTSLMGLVVYGANSAGEARIRAKNAPATIQLLICDVVLPDGRGPELALELRQRCPN